MTLQNMDIVDMTKVFDAIYNCIITPNYNVGFICPPEYKNFAFDFLLSEVPAYVVELVNPYEINFNNGSRLAVYSTESSFGRESKQITTGEL